MNLQEMQRQFGKICTRNPCICDDHYAMARCLEVFSRNQPADLEVDGTRIAVLGMYHSWTTTTVWSKLIKRIKHNNEGHLVSVRRAHSRWVHAEPAAAVGRIPTFLFPVPRLPRRSMSSEGSLQPI